MFAASGFADADRQDASLAHFAHTLGCRCSHCQTIRRLGPKGTGNPLARLMASAQGSLVTDDDADRLIQALPKAQRRKAARIAHKRGYRGLLDAIRAA